MHVTPDTKQSLRRTPWRKEALLFVQNRMPRICKRTDHLLESSPPITLLGTFPTPE